MSQGWQKAIESWVYVSHTVDADTATPLVLLQLRTDAGDVGLVPMTADLAQELVDQVNTAIDIVRRGTDQSAAWRRPSGLERTGRAPSSKVRWGVASACETRNARCVDDPGRVLLVRILDEAGTGGDGPEDGRSCHRIETDKGPTVLQTGERAN